MKKIMMVLMLCVVLVFPVLASTEDVLEHTIIKSSTMTSPGYPDKLFYTVQVTGIEVPNEAQLIDLANVIKENAAPEYTDVYINIFLHDMNTDGDPYFRSVFFNENFYYTVHPEERNSLINSPRYKQGLAKAYREINFGDSPEIVELKITNDPELTKGYGATVAYTNLVGQQFMLIFQYYNDKLYEVSFTDNKEYSADYLDTKVSDIVNDLAAVISNKYGAPSYQKQLSILNMSNGYIALSHVWNEAKTAEEKEIRIGIGERDFKFYAGMYVTYLPLSREKENAERQSKDSSVKDTSNDF